MNEQKRRGRPPKVQWSAAAEPSVIPATFTDAEPSAAQAYALRIWNGQSPDLSRHERLGRIADALAGQGMSMEGVVL